MKQNIATLVIAAIALVFLAMHSSALPWTPMRIAGVAIGIPAFLLLIVARMQLGSAFSLRARASTLVTTGLYSRIRNPVYLFGGLSAVGIFLWSGHPWLLLALLVLVPLQIVRIRKEEQVLAEKFGDAYLNYKRTTWF